MNKNYNQKFYFDHWAKLYLKPGDVIRRNIPWWVAYNHAEWQRRKNYYSGCNSNSDLVDFCRWVYATWVIDRKTGLFPSFKDSDTFLIIDINEEAGAVRFNNDGNDFFIVSKVYKLLHGTKIWTAVVKHPNFFNPNEPWQCLNRTIEPVDKKTTNLLGLSDENKIESKVGDVLSY